MSLFDKMFKKNKLDEALEKGYEEFAENNPVTRKAKATIEDAAKEMKREAPLKVTIALIPLAIALCAFGIYRGEVAVVLAKAINLCLECIGLG